MMIRRGFLLLSLFLILFLCGSAWTDSWMTIRKASEKITSIQADFVQEKHLRILKNPLVSKGVLYFQKPGCIRWEYRSPIKSVLTVNEGRVRRYIAQGETGWTEDASAGIKAMGVVIGEMLKWLNGDFSENPDFDTKLSANGTIVLTPRSDAISSIIEKIEIKLSKTPGVIESVIIIEEKDSQTAISFKQTLVNTPLEKNLFFKP